MLLYRYNIMPADIRNFFGGKPAATPAKEEKKAPAKKGRARKVVDDSDDEEECVNASSSRLNHMLIPDRVVPKKTTRTAAP